MKPLIHYIASPALAAAMLFSSFAVKASAADTLRVHFPQTPILIEREDNVLCEMRIDSRGGEIFDGVTVKFAPSTALADIESVKLFYGGTEARNRQGLHFRPVGSYIPRDLPSRTLAAHPSYSVLQSEVRNPAAEVRLASTQPLPEGVNYFWISIRMKATGSIDAKISAVVADASVGGKAVPVSICGGTCARRMGIGVRHAGDDGAAAYRIPAFTTTLAGTLLGAYDVRRNSSADLQEAIDIGVSRSTDGGRTWEPMRIAMTFAGEGGMPAAQTGVGDPAILVDEVTGRIWIVAAHTFGMGNARAWNNSMPGMTEEWTAQLMMVYSDDDGQTWSTPVNITRQVKEASWHFLLQGPGRGITMKDGTLVFPIQFIDSERIPHAGIMYSRDRGESWHITSPARSNTTEAQVAEVQEGVLMLNMRDNRGGSRAVSVTADLGATWSEHPSNRKALREPVCMASLLHIGAADNASGCDLLLFSNPDTTNGRNHITVKASTDGGLTWKHAVMLDEEDGWGYSCLTLVDRETVGILYESSVAHMTFQRVKISELLESKAE